jgi:hypothetical protein
MTTLKNLANQRFYTSGS